MSFPHVTLADGEQSPLSSSKTFALFQERASQRQVVPPERSKASLIGAYRSAEE